MRLRRRSTPKVTPLRVRYAGWERTGEGGREVTLVSDGSSVTYDNPDGPVLSLKLDGDLLTVSMLAAPIVLNRSAVERHFKFLDEWTREG